MTDLRTHTAVTCLGCGCTCDDIVVSTTGAAIVAVEHACARGRAWFGTGATRPAVEVDASPKPIEEAVGRAALSLSTARRPRVLLGHDVSCEAYAEAVACGDLLRARVDVAGAHASMETTLTIQAHGIATATLGEIRHRARALVFWGVDPAESYPRYRERYTAAPWDDSLDQAPTRTVIAIDVGDARGPKDADVRIAVPPGLESAMLAATAACLGGSTTSAPTSVSAPGDAAGALATLLAPHAYVAVVADAMRSALGTPPAIGGLLALSRALNLHHRGALSLLRGDNNSAGAEVVLTRHTGYPMAVDFSSGAPRYRPYATCGADTFDAVLLVGVPPPHAPFEVGSATRTVAIGPRATCTKRGRGHVAIDTATAGVHSGGTAVRLDDVHLPLTQLVHGPPDAATVCRQLRTCLEAMRA